MGTDKRPPSSALPTLPPQPGDPDYKEYMEKRRGRIQTGPFAETAEAPSASQASNGSAKIEGPNGTEKPTAKEKPAELERKPKVHTFKTLEPAFQSAAVPYLREVDELRHSKTELMAGYEDWYKSLFAEIQKLHKGFVCGNTVEFGDESPNHVLAFPEPHLARAKILRFFEGSGYLITIEPSAEKADPSKFGSSSEDYVAMNIRFKLAMLS